MYFEQDSDEVCGRSENSSRHAAVSATTPVSIPTTVSSVFSASALVSVQGSQEDETDTTVPCPKPINLSNSTSKRSSSSNRYDR